MKTSIKTRLAELLKSSGIDELELANRIKKHPSTIYRIMNGDNEPSKTTIKLLADGLGVNVEYLTSGTGEKLKKTESADPYRDYAIQQLEQRVHDKESEATTWKQKYDQVWNRLEFFLERLPLEQMMGKHSPNEETGLLQAG